MKVSEALKIYRGYRAELIQKGSSLAKEKQEADARVRITGSKKDMEKAATLELSIYDNNKKFEDNQKVLDALTEQESLIANSVVSKQQADAVKDYYSELGKIMEVARRIAKGDHVPATDEKKLMDFNPKLYQAVKNAAVLAKYEKRKKHDSLWEEEEDKKEYEDPLEVAGESEVPFELPSIPASEAGGDIESEADA